MNTASVVEVGEGRGFVMESSRLGRIVVTAAHCLPFMPPPISASYTEEKTYKQIVGPIGSQPSIWAECVFADPVADIAVLASPDSQSLGEAWEVYEVFMEALEPFQALTDVPDSLADLSSDSLTFQGRILSLRGEWQTCKIRRIGHFLFVDGNIVKGGMSGSPIVVGEMASGVLALGTETVGGSLLAQASLSCLPMWLFSELALRAEAR